MKLRIEKFRLPLALFFLALLTFLTACGSSTPQTEPQNTEPAAATSVEASPLFAATPTASPADAEPPAVPSPVTGQPEADAPAAPAEAANVVPEKPAARSGALTRRTAIEQGHAVLSGKSSLPCHNAEELVSFYEDYKAGTDSSVQIYSFRTQDDGEQLYTLYTLTLSGGATKMTEDTTHYYDTERFPELEEKPGITELGTFTMAKNKYGFLTVDVEGESGLLQYHYQIIGYDELYPSIQKYAEEFQMYLEPLAGTGILEFSWSDSSQLLDAEVFPEAFEMVASGEVTNRDAFWNAEKKTYSFPQELVEDALMPRFGLTAELLRALPAYNAESASYNYIPRSNAGLTDLRILKVSQPEEGSSSYTPGADESLLELRYEFYSAENGEPTKRGKLTVLLTAEDDFRYLGNELFASADEETTEAS